MATGILPITSNPTGVNNGGLHNPSQQMVVANTAPGTASTTMNMANGTSMT